MRDEEALALIGTRESPAASRQIGVGDFELTLEDGGLRHIRYRGTETLRGIELVARDDRWGTLPPERANETEHLGDGKWHYAYDAKVTSDVGDLELRVEVRVEGNTIEMTARIKALSDFTTRRVGLVVLHPIDRVAGEPVTITHSDGSLEHGRFPVTISPGQPFFDIAALSHAPGPGLVAECTLHGDVFEMEDQRNWTDASFKTYNRPLAWPSPYVVAAGEEQVQRVTLVVRRSAETPARSATGPEAAGIRLGGAGRDRLPALGTGIDVHQLTRGADPGRVLRELGPTHAQLLIDLREDRVVEDLRATAAALSAVPGIPLRFGIVLPEEEDPARALTGLAEHFVRLGLAPSGVLALPAGYLKSHQPDGPWPPPPTPVDAIRLARDAFPGVAIGGGMLTYFTELNRCPPEPTSIDYISHATTAIVHAADDTSVMETLHCLPHVLRSGQALAPGVPYHVGMSAIGMWANPYGRGTLPNPEHRRLPMASDDPRQAGLFGAAWHLGYYAAAAQCGIDSVALSSPVAPFAVVERGRYHPVFHVLRGLARGHGATSVALDNDEHARVAALAWSTESGEGFEMWLANLTSERVQLRPDGMDLTGTRRFTGADVENASADPEWMDRLDAGSAESTFDLGPYELIRAVGRRSDI